MVNYANMRFALKGEAGAAERCAQRLIGMRKSLASLRMRKKETSLLLATWNIRDFDSNKFGFGPRLAESFYYIAEMISCFDLVAVQEVNQDLAALEKVMRILGREWDYITTDVTEGLSGNGERIAFLYNTEKVWFRKVAGEIVLPQGQLVVSEEKLKAAPQAQPDIDRASGVEEMQQQFARSPFLVAFQSGWFRFSLCTVHIYFGADSGPKLARRISEIEQLVQFFAKRQDKENQMQEKRFPDRDHSQDFENYILLGDFNVVSPEHKTMQALKENDFKVPKEIDGSRIDGQGNFYDQIAVRVKDPRFKVLGGGVVDMFTDVFRSTDDDMKLYDKYVPAEDPEANPQYKAKTAKARFEKWRTWQMSDHAPLWIEIDTDFSESYLGDIAKGK